MSEFRRYVAVVEQANHGTYFAHIPDLPGPTAAARTIDEVLRLLAEFADDHVSDLVAAGAEVPDAASWEEFVPDPEVTEVLRAIVPVKIPPKVPRTAKISISIDEDLLERIDHVARMAGETRSGFIAVAARERAEKVAAAPLDQLKMIKEIEAAGGLGVVLDEVHRKRKRGLDV